MLIKGATGVTIHSHGARWRLDDNNPLLLHDHRPSGFADFIKEARIHAESYKEKKQGQQQHDGHYHVHGSHGNHVRVVAGTVPGLQINGPVHPDFDGIVQVRTGHRSSNHDADDVHAVLERVITKDKPLHAELS